MHTQAEFQKAQEYSQGYPPLGLENRDVHSTL